MTREIKVGDVGYQVTRDEVEEVRCLCVLPNGAAIWAREDDTAYNSAVRSLRTVYATKEEAAKALVTPIQREYTRMLDSIRWMEEESHKLYLKVVADKVEAEAFRVKHGLD